MFKRIVLSKTATIHVGLLFLQMWYWLEHDEDKYI